MKLRHYHSSTCVDVHERRGGVNFYAYAGNNPTNFTNRSGTQIAEGAIAGGVVGGPPGAIVGAVVGVAIVGVVVVAAWYTGGYLADQINASVPPMQGRPEIDTAPGGFCCPTAPPGFNPNIFNTDLTDPTGRRHILDGDATGGGHGPGRGIPGKSEFPSSWSDDEVINAVSDVATDPSSIFVPGRGGRTVADGTRNGVDIRVITEGPARGNRIVTGYPTNIPRNP